MKTLVICMVGLMSERDELLRSVDREIFDGYIFAGLAPTLFHHLNWFPSISLLQVYDITMYIPRGSEYSYKYYYMDNCKNIHSLTNTALVMWCIDFD